MNHINNLTDSYLGLSDMQYERTSVIEQAINDIRKSQNRDSGSLGNSINSRL